MPSKKNVVVIPIYQTSLSNDEVFSIRNATAVLANHSIYFVGPVALVQQLKKLTQHFDHPISVKTFPDQYFANIAGYNSLMLSSMFYEAFAEYHCILIAQTDSLVFSDELNYWADKNYSYIGAPWFEGYTKPTMPLRWSCVGNGGFSLRNVSDFLRVLNTPRIFKNTLMESWPGSWISTVYRYLKDYHSFVYKNVHLNIDVNEDLFWSLFVAPRCPFFKIPGPEEAIAFAFEAHPEYSLEMNQGQLPFGCHAWQRYNPDFWYAILANRQLVNSY